MRLFDDDELELERVEMELNRVRNLIDETDEAFKLITEHLSPYWNAKGEIEHDVLRTHGRSSNNTVVFRPDGAPDRVPLFAALKALAEEWGPVTRDRTMLKTRLSGYEREERAIAKELKRLRGRGAKPKARRDTGQESLF
jgi:hypothetical protein